MAQADIVIVNGSGLAVHTAINAALQALGTSNSGATAPSITYAYQLWLDTANTLLKIRNSANSAWISLGNYTVTNFGYMSLPALPGSTLPMLLSSAGVVSTGQIATAMIANNAVGNAQLRQGAALSLIGNNTNGSANVADIAAANDNDIMRRQGTAIGFGKPGFNIASKTTTYTTTVTDDTLNFSGASGAYTVTLHTPTFNQQMTLIRTDSTLANVITISGTISGATNWTLNTQQEKYELQYSVADSEWKLLNHVTITDDAIYTAVFVAFGTVTVQKMSWRRVGSHCEILGAFTSGTSTGSTASMTLPTGITTGSSTFISTAQYGGDAVRSSGTAALLRMNMIVKPAQTTLTFGAWTASTGCLTDRIGTDITNAADIVSIYANFIVAGWKA